MTVALVVLAGLLVTAACLATAVRGRLNPPLSTAMWSVTALTWLAAAAEALS